MNISKLNPIGYESKTEQGNTYKKSNLGKSGMITVAAVSNGLPVIFKNNPIARSFTSKALVEDMAKTLFNKEIPAKLKTPLAVAATIFDVIMWISVGIGIDKSINKKRAANADAEANTAAAGTKTVDTQA